MRLSGLACVISVVFAVCLPLHAQTDYEIQVYGSDTVEPGVTMVELHSNFTFTGTKTMIDGMIPTNHALHETLEITHGWNDWFETGFYVFTSDNPGYGYAWVGDHIRPRVRVPESWKWPVGFSISIEFGYQRALYNGDTWDFELRPIIDKQIGKLYLAANPAFERSFHGPTVPGGVGLSPSFKAGYDFTKVINAGLEYYGDLGPLKEFDALGQQWQQIVPAVDLNFSKNWEFNAGMGVGVTHGTDHLVFKCIIGRRLEFGKKKP
jgi:hypothetical protein